MQEFGRKVGTVGPLDGVARQAVLREFVKAEQFAEHFARQVRLQVAELARPVVEGEQQLVVLHIIYIGYPQRIFSPFFILVALSVPTSRPFEPSPRG